MSQGAKNHILERHAGSRQGFPNKSKFPAAWTDEQILDAVDLALARPGRIELYGDQFVFTGVIDGVTVRVSARRRPDAALDPCRL